MLPEVNPPMKDHSPPEADVVVPELPAGGLDRGQLYVGWARGARRAPERLATSRVV